MQVRWESQSAATPMGQLAYFIEFLTLTGLWSRWRDSCPLVTGNQPALLPHLPRPYRSERGGLAANSGFHSLGVS